MSDIFLSYSRKDFKKVEAIKEELERELGVSCWMDLEGIDYNSPSFVKVVVKAINESPVFCFMLSASSQLSEYALSEIALAKDKNKPLFLLNIDKCKLTDEFAFMYRYYNMCDYADPVQKAKLFRELRQKLNLPDDGNHKSHEAEIRKREEEERIRREREEAERKRREEAERKRREEERKRREEEEKEKARLQRRERRRQWLRRHRGWLFCIPAAVLMGLFAVLMPHQCDGIGHLTSVSGTIAGHAYVDLGLSVKWATCNVGATQPEGYGEYFAWGETETKTEYTEGNSKTYDKPLSDISGDSRYDVARAWWGGSWRMPTKAELEELEDKCRWQWTTVNGVVGYKVTGPNGNSIFLPAAGYRLGSDFDYVGLYGYYWSSTPGEFRDDGAYYLRFFDSSQNVYFDESLNVYWGIRNYGLSVRPVSE